MPIEKLEAEHREVLEMAEALEAAIAGPYPERSAAFMQIRWNFTREVLTHLSHDEALVMVPLMGDRRPHIAHLAAQSRVQLRQLYNDFEAHMARWMGLPAEREWSQYRREVHTLMRRLRARVAAEETGIYHFLPVQRGDRHIARSPADYAPGIRDGIYAEAGADRDAA